jgi:hypothetical protein
MGTIIIQEKTAAAITRAGAEEDFITIVVTIFGLRI